MELALSLILPVPFKFCRERGNGAEMNAMIARLSVYIRCYYYYYYYHPAVRSLKIVFGKFEIRACGTGFDYAFLDF